MEFTLEEEQLDRPSDQFLSEPELEQQSMVTDPTVPHGEQNPKLQTQEKGFWSSLKERSLVMAMAYFVSMALAGTLLIILNTPVLGAAYGESTPPGLGTWNAVLWAFVGVATFLFALGIIFAVRRRRVSRVNTPE